MPKSSVCITISARARAKKLWCSHSPARQPIAGQRNSAEWLTAKGVSGDLEIAIQKKKDYFPLAEYSDKTCKKPVIIAPADNPYNWTRDNLKALIGGAR